MAKSPRIRHYGEAAMRIFAKTPLGLGHRTNRRLRSAIHVGSASAAAVAVLLAGALGQSALAGAQGGTRIGWGYDSEPSQDYDCPVQACFSNATKRGSVVIDHLATGSYEIVMDYLYKAGPSDVQIGIADENTPSYCTTAGWGPGEYKAVDVFVNCYDAGGNPMDSILTFLYQSRSQPLGSAEKGIAFLWADQPTEASYTPNPGYQFNSTGATNSMTRNGTGSYTASIPGLTKNGGNVQVTAYGNGPARCKVSDWNSSQSGTSVNVLCFDGTGAAADEMFTLAYTISEPLGLWRTDGDYGDAGAYVWANKSKKTKIYTPPHAYNYNGFRAGALSVQRNSTGYYTVTVPGDDLFIGSAALVTANGNANSYCTVGDSESGWMPITIHCFDQNGNPGDSSFSVLLQTAVLE
jgi:hypothetical protein